MKMLPKWLLIVGLSALSACGKAEQGATPITDAPVKTTLPTVKVSEVGTPELHYLDGHVEAVNESTLSAQTSGVIEKLF